MRTLIHLYGPLGLHSFGLVLASGFLSCTYLLKQHPLRIYFLSLSHLNFLITGSVLTAFLGGKILFLFCNTQAFSLFTMGGFSLLGSIGSVLIFLVIYLWYKSIAILPVLDLFALHAPLLQSIARVGCFLSGCCYGIAGDSFWTVIYRDPSSLAPLHIPLHPTQLYSALLLYAIYLLISKNFCHQRYLPGKLTMYYFMLIGLERFFIDFLRGDREFYLRSTLSIHQWIALLFFVGASGILIILKRISLPRTI